MYILENSESRNPIQIKSSDDKDEEKSIDKIDEDDDGEKKIDIESGASEQEKSAESDCSKPEVVASRVFTSQADHKLSF